MACYYCDNCGDLKDGDHEPCVEHPDGSNKLVCEECAAELEEEAQIDADFKRERAAYNREQANMTVNHCKKHGY